MLRRPVPSALITKTSGFPALPWPGERAVVMNRPSGEKAAENHSYVPATVCVIRWRSDPSGRTRNRSFCCCPAS